MLAQRPDLDWRPPPSRLPHVTFELVALPAPEQRLPAARAALAAHDWQCAYELLSAEDRAVPLSAEDLEGLAEAAYWLGRYRKALPARQRAHHAYLQAGDHRRAAVAAVVLAMQNLGLRQFAVASGWLQRAQRLLAPSPTAPSRVTCPGEPCSAR